MVTGSDLMMFNQHWKNWGTQGDRSKEKQHYKNGCVGVGDGESAIWEEDRRESGVAAHQS